MYKVVGYYICEVTEVSQWLNINSNRQVSVSDCFGGTHPQLDNCYFLNDRIQEKEEYRRYWSLDNDKSKRLTDDIGKLFEKKLAIDGRFMCLSDAQYFYNTYFSSRNCMVVSLSSTGEYVELLENELSENSNCKNVFFNGSIDENALLGFDILGWDISGFHSFLCNGLQSVLPSARFNNYSLLENTFDEVEEFSKQICDMGEPVEWIPCRIGKC